MKKLMKAAILVTCLCITSYSASYAVTALALDGNEYMITAFCRDDAGIYCNKGDVKKDIFIFKDGKFIVNSFDDGIYGLGDNGTFNKQKMSFEAMYEVKSEDNLEKYTFEIKAIKMSDYFIFGQLHVIYYTQNIICCNKEAETKAFFFGKKIKQ